MSYHSYSELINATCDTGAVRLVGGHSNNSGRVEICYQNQWGTVCDDGWSSTDARVVCNQLGYSPIGTSILLLLKLLILWQYYVSMFYATGAVILLRTQYNAGRGPIFLDNVGCRGTESSLLECYHPGIGVHNCQHDDDIGIECSRILYTPN